MSSKGNGTTNSGGGGSGGSGKSGHPHGATAPQQIFDPKTKKLYKVQRLLGAGSFGVVFQATDQDNDSIVAIKSVLQDKRFKNRELEIMQMLSHSNCVRMLHHFYTGDSSTGDEKVYLNLVLEFIPETLYRVERHYRRLRQTIPILNVRLYAYQLFRSLAFCHASGIVHRDVKPQNLLLDPYTGTLKLCDFGSAKVILPGAPNVSYICSRYYRAPELIFGSTRYTIAIDVWSAGCVLAEMLLGVPLFPGETGVNQLVEIIKVLGTPSPEDIQSMNPHYTQHHFPSIRASPWSSVFRGGASGAGTPPSAVDLIAKILVFDPRKRLTALEVLAHPFFDTLREQGTNLPSGRPFPPLFDFCDSEIALGYHLRDKLIPEHSSESRLSPEWRDEPNPQELHNKARALLSSTPIVAAFDRIHPNPSPAPM